MHPEVEQVGPGACPICGMDLEPKFADAADDSDEQQFRDMKRRFWVGVCLVGAAVDHGDGADGRFAIGRIHPGWMVWLAAACVGNAGRVLVRLAAACSRCKVVSDDEPEHVLADCGGNARRIPVQSFCRLVSAIRSRRLSLKTANRRSISRPLR